MGLENSAREFIRRMKDLGVIVEEELHYTTFLFPDKDKFSIQEGLGDIYITKEGDKEKFHEGWI
jgi:hypothetical protein